MKRDPDVAAVCELLAAYFDPREVKWKAQTVKANRALAVAYIDARLVMDRLDSAVGAENWQDDYTPLGNGHHLCTLRLRIGTEWIGKADVGVPSEQPDGGDRDKAAVSDALKRAAVKWGVGRYLYRLPSQWVEYDPAKRQLAQVPHLPAWAVPAKYTPESAARRATAIVGLIRQVCAATNTDAEKASQDTLAAHKVKDFADLRADDAAALLVRLGNKVAEIAAKPAGASGTNLKQPAQGAKP